MIQKHKFVEKNLDMFKKLTKLGYVSSTLLNYYDIYKRYMSIKNEKKLKRYDIVAKETRSSVMTVRRAVSEMKSYVRD